MKILQINKLYYPTIGGVEKIVQEIAENFNQQANIEVDVLVCQNRGRRQIEKINGVTVYRAATIGKILSLPLSLDLFYLFLKIRKNYDLILIHHPFPLIFLILPWVKNKNLFIWYHSDIVRQKISKHFFQPCINYALKKSQRIFVSSNQLKNSSRLLKKYQAKCEIIHFGLKTDRTNNSLTIRQKVNEIRKKYPFPLILSVGRLVPYKGFKYLIKAMVTVPKAQLLIIGQGPLKKQLDKLISDNKLEQRITIIASVADLTPFYQACDVFALPSCQQNEAFALVQLEAMAQGKPVINTAIPTGVPEVSRHNISGLTVTSRNSFALSEAINRLLTDKELRIRLGQGAQERVRQVFNQRTFIERLRYFLIK